MSAQEQNLGFSHLTHPLAILLKHKNIINIFSIATSAGPFQAKSFHCPKRNRNKTETKAYAETENYNNIARLKFIAEHAFLKKALHTQ
jgi:predicted patatin/cPLA2 family phospholipase